MTNCKSSIWAIGLCMLIGVALPAILSAADRERSNPHHAARLDEGWREKPRAKASFEMDPGEALWSFFFPPKA